MKRYWWIVLAALLAGLGSTALFALGRTPTYLASATLVVGPNETLTTSREIVDSLNALDRRSVVATFARIPPSRTLQARSEQRLGLSPGQAAPYAVKTIIVPDTNVLEISVEGPDRRLVAALANELAVQTIGYAREFYQIYALKQLDRAAEPGEAIGPKLLRKLVAGGLLGLLIGVAAAFLLSRLRPSEEPDEPGSGRDGFVGRP